jgi:hypothetical protein
MNIRITTYHPALPFMLKQSAPAGVDVSFPPVIERRSMGHETLHEIFVFAGGIGKDITVALFTSWLYDHLKQHKAESVEIDGKNIPVTEADIKSAIEVVVTHQW